MRIALLPLLLFAPDPPAPPAPALEPAEPPVETRWVGPSGYAMVRIAAGSFVMGSPEGEAGREPDEARHEVRITRDFWLGETEITQAFWSGVMGTSPFEAEYKGVSLVAPEFPAQNVSWFDALQLANALSQRDGLAPAYTVSGTQVAWDPRANGYRLPTEAEWEYAARAGQDRIYTGARGAGSLCATANVADAAARRRWKDWTGAVQCDDGFVGPSAARSLLPNPWGLYDVSGNVGEWVWDWFGPYAAGPVDDPTGAAIGVQRVARGGSWAHNGTFTRVAKRERLPPETRSAYVGIRLARWE